MSSKFVEVDQLKRSGDVASLCAKLGAPDAQASDLLRRAVASALRTTGSRHAMDSMIELLHDPVSSIRQVAIEALGELGDHSAVRPIAERLSNDDTGLRSLAAKALGEIGGHEAVEALIVRGMHDDQDAVRMAAAAALGHLKAREALDVLCIALSDGSGMVRVDAAVALVRIRDDRAVEPLQTYWDGATKVQRWAVKRQLEATGLTFPASPRP